MYFKLLVLWEMLWRSSQTVASSELCELLYQRYFFQNAVQFDCEFLSDHPLEMINKEQVTLCSGSFCSVLTSFLKFA